MSIDAAVQVWRRRNDRTAKDAAYFAYVTLLVALVAVVPVARAAWLALLEPRVLTVLIAPFAADVTGAAAAALWAGALVLGRYRGPAVLPPFLTWALGVSASPRSRTYRSTVLRAWAVPVCATIAASSVVGAVLVVGGHATTGSAALFLIAGLLTGVIAAAAWLLGQALPRAAACASAFLLAGAVPLSLTGIGHAFFPWGWVALAYPSPRFGSVWPLAALAVFATFAVLTAPKMLGSLRLRDMQLQAVRWEMAVVHSAGIDLSAAASTFRALPSALRRVRAVRWKSSPVTRFFLRDAVGALRTPGRFAAAVVALAVGAALVATAAREPETFWILGAVAGLTSYGALGPLTDGVRHAADIRGDLPLYGYSNRTLLALHTTFPATCAAIIAFVTSFLALSLAPGGFATAPSSLQAALLLVVCLLVARIADAAKGPLPPAFLTPVPTPLGDLGAAVRLIWALEGPALAATAGVSVLWLVQAPMVAVTLLMFVFTAAIVRWRRR